MIVVVAQLSVLSRTSDEVRGAAVFLRSTRRIIGNLRATVMEGSFGNQKLHFGLGVIAARNSRSETLLLFFGIHLANASILAARQLAREEKARAKEIRA